MKRILVCGGRAYPNRRKVFEVLDSLAPMACIIQGGARGADALAAEWANKNGVPNIPFQADWDTYGRGAGMIRNRVMLREGKPDLVVAFPGGNGTADMTRIAQKAGIQVMIVKEEGNGNTQSTSE